MKNENERKLKYSPEFMGLIWWIKHVEIIGLVVLLLHVYNILSLFNSIRIIFFYIAAVSIFSIFVNSKSRKNHRNLFPFFVLLFAVPVFVFWDPWVTGNFNFGLLIFLYAVLICCVVYSFKMHGTYIFKYPALGYCRSVLELAGQEVATVEDGFSGRPYPAGKLDYSVEEIRTFANILDRFFIASTIIDKERAIIVFTHGLYNYFSRPKLQNSTYVEFDYSGNMSVHIAKKDYEKYKEELTFDELCKALGELVIKFFELYKEGKEDEILRMLKGVK